MHSRFFLAGLAASILVASLAADAAASPAAGCAPPLRPRIAEILYDAAGDDTGHEFVELYNPNPFPFLLAGARLEAGDGSGPGRWSARWTAGAADTAPALGRFVVGGAAVLPAPDRIANLDLQNGPDAVRITWPDGAVEVVGYGAHEFPEYFCSAPAADVPSGQSLARIPDAADEGSNALDFRAAAPSPGAANRPAVDLALVAGSLVLAPERPAPFTRARLTVRISNRGARPVAADSARIELREAGSAVAPTEVPLRFAPAPGETVSVSMDVPGLPPGKRVLVVRAVAAGDEAPGNDADSLRVRVGPGPLEITEIQFHPGSGEGEWVEVRNRSAGSVAPEDLLVFDRRDSPGRPHGGALAPESLAVLAQDRGALLARFAGLDSARVWAVAPWPSLNNSDGEDGVADAVVLREADGTLIERVEYSAGGVPPGVPLERREGDVWLAAVDPAGSPLAPPRPVLPVAGGFDVEPRRFRPGAPATLRWALPWPRSRVACEVYDLAGRRRGTLMAETVVPGHAERVSSGLDLGAGVYVIVLRARPESGEGALTVARPVRVAGER